MNDYIKKFKEISLTDTRYKEELYRYEIDYHVVLENGLPSHLTYIKIMRTDFRDGKDIVEEVHELPYFMEKNLEAEELTGWATNGFWL